MPNTKILEESLLQAVDAVAEQSDDKVTKILADLFKSEVLKKYKAAFDDELKQGRIHKDNVDKAVEYCFSDICVSIRTAPGLNNDEIEKGIKVAKSQLGTIKQTVLNILVSKNIEIIE